MKESQANLSVNVCQDLMALYVGWTLMNVQVTHVTIMVSAMKDLLVCFFVSVSLGLKDQHVRGRLIIVHSGHVNIMVSV